MAKGRIPGDMLEEAFVGTQAIKDAITANPGGGQANAVALITQISRVTVVGTAGDSVKLPALSTVPPGTEVVVINAAAANSLNVFPASGDAIDALGANAARAVAAGKTATFISLATATAGTWASMVGA